MHMVVNFPAQLVSPVRIDSRQTGPGLIWRGSNWAKESQYETIETIEQNELTGFMSHESMSLSPSYILLCNSLALSGIDPILGMEVPCDARHNHLTHCYINLVVMASKMKPK